MKKTLLPLILLIIGFKIYAQQLPQYTQYTFNELLINPAVSGIESYWDVKTGYRTQWTGLQGAPTTAYFTLSIPLNQNFTLHDYSQMIRNSDNPVGRDGADSYSAPENHGGISLSLINDKAGAYGQTHFNAGYAYHLQLSNKLNLATGTSIGFDKINLNANQLIFANPNDPAVGEGSINKTQPEAALGIWLYAPSYFIGASAQQLIPQTSGSQSTSNIQYFLTVGAKLYPSNDITLLPSVVFNPSKTLPVNFDANLKLAFRDIFWVGVAYRKSDAITGSLGINIGSFLTLGYAYDHSISDFNTVSNGTHEIMLGLFLNNNYNTTSARHTW